MVPISGESYRRDSIQLELSSQGLVEFENQPSFSGGCSEGETPVPIPNTEGKPLSADGTAWVTVWESRSLPGIIYKTALGHSESRFPFWRSFLSSDH